MIILCVFALLALKAGFKRFSKAGFTPQMQSRGCVLPEAARDYLESAGPAGADVFLQRLLRSVPRSSLAKGRRWEQRRWLVLPVTPRDVTGG